jgi:aspartyl protease family protein
LGILSAFSTVCLAAPLSVTSSDASVESRGEREVPRQAALQGILGSKALLLVDGERLILSVGQTPKSGVRVLHIDVDSVEIVIDGKRQRLRLGDSHSVTTPYKKRESVDVTIYRDKSGMYNTIGSINGLPVSFLVDTGATTVAMNKQHAKRLAIDFRVTGEPTLVSTASGMTRAYRVTLDKVSVGGIILRNVAAVVMDGNFPVQVLLGMTFLGKLEIQHEGTALRLKKTF